MGANFLFHSKIAFSSWYAALIFAAAHGFVFTAAAVKIEISSCLRGDGDTGTGNEIYFTHAYKFSSERQNKKSEIKSEILEFLDDSTKTILKFDKKTDGSLYFFIEPAEMGD